MAGAGCGPAGFSLSLWGGAPAVSANPAGGFSMNRFCVTALAALAACAMAPAALAAGVADSSAQAPVNGVSAAPPAHASTAPSDGDKMVCKRVEVTGSNFPAHICHTKTQWADIDDRNNKDATDDYRQRGSRIVAPK